MLEIILYVRDQQKSTLFYSKLFNMQPSLNVPGMTEFKPERGVILGLMPENGIAKIITPISPHPSLANGIPRCELYLRVDDPENWNDRAVAAGAKLISKALDRDWGDVVAYSMDPDGHILAFARKT